MIAPGYKANMGDMAAAIGIEQLKKATTFWELRQHCAERYTEGLSRVPAVQTPSVRDSVRHAWHMYVVQLRMEELRISRDEFSLQLDQMGIENSVHYRPLHLHSYYRRAFGYAAQDLPAATAAYDRVLSLPIFPGLTDVQIDQVIESVAILAKKYRR